MAGCQAFLLTGCKREGWPVWCVFCNLAKSTESIEQVSKRSSLKLVMVAEGSADIYPRLAPTIEWETAAADAVVRESGKMTYQFENNEVVIYNKENLLNSLFIRRKNMSYRIAVIDLVSFPQYI